MAVRRVCLGAMAMVAALVLDLAIALAATFQGQSSAPAPAPAPTSDGTTIDQGIACGLMLLALVLTYIIHAADFPINF